MNRIRNRLAASSFLCIALSTSAQAQYTILHSFTGGTNDGGGLITQGYPLTLSGSVLYGATYAGGGSNLGTIFKISTDGSGFSLLHSFAGGTNDGSKPGAGLTLIGSTLYGTTRGGGNKDSGTIYKMNTDGSGFTILHAFQGGSSDGSNPQSGLTLSGSNLYGTTYSGGPYLGTAYSIGTDATGYSVLHYFLGGFTDGSEPIGAGNLVLSGTTAFGTTLADGPNSSPLTQSAGGTIFEIGVNGGYGILHTCYPFFQSSYNSQPAGLFEGLVLSGTSLYGTSMVNPSIYKIDTDGSDFSVVHAFSGGSDGTRPGDLAVDGSKIYGASSGAGIFEMNADGTGFTILHPFSTADGTFLAGSPVIDGNTMYGMTYQGGTAGLGTIFSFVVPEPSTLTLAACGLAVCAIAAIARLQRCSQGSYPTWQDSHDQRDF